MIYEPTGSFAISADGNYIVESIYCLCLNSYYRLHLFTGDVFFTVQALVEALQDGELSSNEKIVPSEKLRPNVIYFRLRH